MYSSKHLSISNAHTTYVLPSTYFASYLPSFKFVLGFNVVGVTGFGLTVGFEELGLAGVLVVAGAFEEFSTVGEVVDGVEVTSTLLLVASSEEGWFH